MFNGFINTIFGLAADALKNKGYSDNEIAEVLYAIRHLDYKFVLKKRKENRERVVAS